MFNLYKKVVKNPHVSGRHGWGEGGKEGWWWELEKWSTKATGKELEMKAPSN